jgi:hypothetical protein
VDHASCVAGAGVLEIAFHHVAYDHRRSSGACRPRGLPAEFIEDRAHRWWTTCFGNMPVRERLRADDLRRAPTSAG